MPAYRAALASLADPPDTSQLERCDERETAHAISTLTMSLTRRRKALLARHASGAVLERLLGAVRRLQNPHLAAYRSPDGIVLSEPFGAVRSALEPARLADAQRLVAKLLGRTPPSKLVKALAAYGLAALQLAADGAVHIVIVPHGRRFAQCSRSVAALVPDIDHWQSPPAGLFVLEERLLLLRGCALRMAAAHEFAHALDAVLAERPRSYYSFESAEVRESFAAATGFVNEYAASGLDEYFAECVRAYVEVNDDASSWLPLTRHDLFTRDPKMFVVIDRLFKRFSPHAQR